MNMIRIADSTLCQKGAVFSFKEKLEIARYLDRLNVDQIDLPKIENEKTDILLINTMATFVRDAVLSVGTDIDRFGIEKALHAVSGIANAGIRIEVPVSPVGMEYIAKKKAPALIAAVAEAVSACKEAGVFTEIYALDATRAEESFLAELTKAAKDADLITLSDDAAEMLPDSFARFVGSISAESGIGVAASNKNGLACADAVLAAKAGASCIKTSAVGTEDIPLETFATVLKNCGNTNGLSSKIRYTELNKTIKQIGWVTDNNSNEKSVVNVSDVDESGIRLTQESQRDDVNSAISRLGYDLSIEDQEAVYEAFTRIAAKRGVVDAHELDAVIASVALEVPQTYKLESYVINSGNIINTSAQISMRRDDQILNGIDLGDGPVDAAFLAIEKIIGHHYELDDFQIQALSEGKEALGQTVVKLRNNGKLYSGKGISSDIIGASIRAYISAVNKIIYEENNG